MSTADDRRHVMLAVGFEPDIAQQHNFVVAADLLEGSLQILPGILEITRKPLFIGADHAGRRSDQSFAIRIGSRPTNERAYGIFGGRARRSVDGGDRAGHRSSFRTMIEVHYFIHLIPRKNRIEIPLYSIDIY